MLALSRPRPLSRIGWVRAAAQNLGGEERQRAIFALEVLRSAMRRLLHLSGCSSREVDTQDKRVRRMVRRLRDGAPLQAFDHSAVEVALEHLGVLHRLLGADQGARIRESIMCVLVAGAFEPTAPRENWPVGTRLFEQVTGAVWWVDEHDPRRPETIGVLPDVGEELVVWRDRAEFRRTPGAR